MKKNIVAGFGMPAGACAVLAPLRNRRRLCLAIAGSLASALVPPTARAQSRPGEYLMSRWKQDRYLHMERGRIEASQIDFGWWSAQWYIRPWMIAAASWVGPCPDTGVLGNLLSKCEEERRRKIAELDQRYQGWFYIENRWKRNQFIHVENGVLEAGTVEAGWESPLWAFDGVDDNFFRIRNRSKPDWFLQLDATGNATAGPVAPGYWSGHWRRYFANS